MTSPDRIRASIDGEHEQAGPAPAAVALAPQLARVLALQRSAGNAAVSALLTSRAAALARDLTDAPAAAEGGAAASPIAGLAEKAGNAAGLRAMLAANPALGDQISAYFASGVQDTALNELMAQAYAPIPEEAAGTQQDGEASELVEKNPKDPTVPLPAARTGDKDLTLGHMKWALTPVNHSSARVNVDFKPDKDKVEAKNVSFGQTVVNQVGAKNVYAGSTLAEPDKTAPKFRPFEDPASKRRMDLLIDKENDPFYGAEWDQANKKWKRETSTSAPGASQKGVSSSSATMRDTPATPMAREGKGDWSTEFETVAMVLETRQPLGALRWGYKVKDAENAPLELTGATDADAVDTPSASWAVAMDRFYAARFDEILDNFDVAKADLKPDHVTKLDNIVTKMKANVVLKAQIGGAADLTGDEKFNQALSLRRATAARDYIVSKGIDAARTELQSYGSDWARVQSEAGKSEGKNRRVQIWLR